MDNNKHKYIGEGSLSVNGMHVSVYILKEKEVYGCKRFLITPKEGNGTAIKEKIDNIKMFCGCAYHTIDEQCTEIPN